MGQVVKKEKAVQNVNSKFLQIQKMCYSILEEEVQSIFRVYSAQELKLACSTASMKNLKGVVLVVNLEKTLE